MTHVERLNRVMTSEPVDRLPAIEWAEYWDQTLARWRMIGGFDKTVMHLGEAAMRGEFERLLPVLQTGGFIPSVDDQTPPAVGWDHYQEYVGMLRQHVAAPTSKETT